RRFAVDEITLGVAEPSVDDRQVRHQTPLHDIALAIELLDRLAVGNRGTDAGLGEEARDTSTAGADTLGQRALWVELDLELAREVLVHEGLVLADVGRDHLLDLLRVEQKADTLSFI